MSFDPEKMIDAVAPFIGLTVAMPYRGGVIQHLVAAQRIAQPLLELKLDDEAEPAPVYTP